MMKLLFMLTLATSGAAGMGLTVVHKPRDVAVLIGTDVMLPCRVSQLGNDHLVWQRSRYNVTGELIFNTSQGQILHSDTKKFQIQGEYNLLIKNVQFEDAGIYGCGTATQEQFYTALLVVIANFSCHEEEINAVEGESISLACSVHYEGFREPHLKWTYGKQAITAGEPAQTGSNNTAHFVHNVTTIAAWNKDGRHFHCELFFKPTPPVFRTHCTTRLVVLYQVRAAYILPAKEELHVGDNLTCHAQGNPRPKYDWSDESSGKVIGHDQVISITSDMAGYNFTYICNATNSVNGQHHAMATRKTFHVTVKGEAGMTQRSTTVAWTVGGVLIVLILLVVLFAIFTRLGYPKEGLEVSKICKCLPWGRKSDKTEVVQDNPLFDVITGDEPETSKDVHELPADAFHPKDLLEGGTFKTTYTGQVRRKGVNKTAVIVMLTESASPEDQTWTLQQARAWRDAKEHVNILNFLAYCTKKDPMMFAVEYAPHATLLQYIRTKAADPNSDTTEGASVALPKDIASYVWQVVRGMSYLETKQLVHTGLMAKKVYLVDKMCKLGDVHYPQHTAQRYLYCLQEKRPLPIQWMAPETFEANSNEIDKAYTIKSCVWAFGVLLWEVTSHGATPYPEESLTDVKSKVLEGQMLKRPSKCQNDLYSLMKKCWQLSPDDRPSFLTLKAVLEPMVQSRRNLNQAEADTETSSSSNLDPVAIQDEHL